MNRIIAIGDVHGCIFELEDLLNQLQLRSSDQVVFLGDLVNNGPNSHAVLKTARQINAKCLLGNHERRLLWYRRKGDPGVLRKADHRTVSSLSRRDWDFMRRFSLTHLTADRKLLLVHGGFLPDQPWQLQPASVVTEMRNLHAAKETDTYRPFWTEQWQGPPFVVYGHTPRHQVDRQKWAWGIDTGCYRGGALSAFVWPDKRIVQIPARKKYA